MRAYNDPAYRRYAALVRRTRPLCHICGLPGADTADHITPTRRGGTNTPTNLAPAHFKCNSSKGARTRIRVNKGY